MLGWTRTVLLKLVPSQLVQGLDNEARVGSIFTLTPSFRSSDQELITRNTRCVSHGSSFARLIQCLDIDSNHNDQLKNLWTLDKSASTAFRNGQIYLEPYCDASEDSDDSCQETSHVCNHTSSQVLPLSD
jgi:hypothetical protein